MRIVVCVLFAACALAVTGCDDKKPDAPKPAATATATAAAKPPAPAKTAAPGGW